MVVYRNIDIKAITKSASEEAEELGFNLSDIGRLLADSYDCKTSKRKKGIEERCIRKDGKILRIVIELRTSKNGFEYWRIRQIDFVR